MYLPTHASFAIYDVIVVTYDSEETRRLFGYQLKEGKKVTRHTSLNSFRISAVIRRLAAAEGTELRGWKIPSISEIYSFFGESGSNWTPTCWVEITTP